MTSENDRKDEMLGQQVSDDWLVDVMKPRRSDPDAFDASVQQAIEERKESGSDDSGVPDNPWLRRAAAIAPFAPVPTSSAKSVLWVLSLPVLLVVGSFATFTSGLRSTRDHSTRDPKSITPAEKARSRAKGQLILGWVQVTPLVAMALPMVTGSLFVRDVMVVGLLLAMLAFTLQVRGASATPAKIAEIGFSLLMTAAVATFLWWQFLPLKGMGSEYSEQASAAVMGLGIIAVSLLRVRYSKYKGEPRAQAIYGLVWVVFVLGFMPSWLSPSEQATPAKLREDIEAFEADTDSLAGWHEIAVAVETLRAIDADLPDLGPIRDSVARAIATPEVDTHPVIWTAAARMGLMDRELWRSLSTHELEEFSLQRFLQGDGKLLLTDFNEYRLWMLRETRDLTADQIQHLLDRIEASWPPKEEFKSLGRSLLLVHLLDLFDRPDLVEARREHLFEVLTYNWTSGPLERHSKVGGFTSNPVEFPTSFAEPTWAGIELMARLGVPPGIDLQILRTYLRSEGSVFSDQLLLYRPAQVLLEQKIGLPERSLFERLVAERMLIATTLLSLLCILSVGIAARSSRERVQLEAETRE